LMASRWVKAVFLLVLGVVILLYANKLVDDLRTAMSQNFDVAFTWTWDLLTVLLWILVAWLFVDAALTIALSFSEHRYTLLDVVKRLDIIEKKLGMVPPKEPVEMIEENAKPVEVSEEEVPPPPKE